MYDLEMLQETGYCAGIENYSLHLSRRKPGEQPWTLLDYFPDDFLMFVDESHISLPQVRGMYAGDRARKDVLVEHGFRLPSARDNRPLTFAEFERMIEQAIFVSATPGRTSTEHSEQRRRAGHPPDRPDRPGRSRSARPRARSTTCCSEINSAGRARASARWSRR